MNQSLSSDDHFLISDIAFGLPPQRWQWYLLTMGSAPKMFGWTLFWKQFPYKICFGRFFYYVAKIVFLALRRTRPWRERCRWPWGELGSIDQSEGSLPVNFKFHQIGGCSCLCPREKFIMWRNGSSAQTKRNASAVALKLACPRARACLCLLSCFFVKRLQSMQPTINLDNWRTPNYALCSLVSHTAQHTPSNCLYRRAVPPPGITSTTCNTPLTCHRRRRISLPYNCGKTCNNSGCPTGRRTFSFG